MRSNVIAVVSTFRQVLRALGIGNVGHLRGLSDALARQKSRTELGKLDDHMLNDIGLTREQAASEASRSMWQD
jgi:uncharacterized protein YjiS (DUF1127 family)